ncbi:RES family NAD+ phosphorylase [Xinfangfangia sp. CPCC 101601]|uniref:RES family NAD+ phosphorylase n=1 Tax=Pseudogemmobacter lacusdianii TaxID=3069608 RepID=A0ABU0W0J4_9RHOB|nr:RES family NAD+ phosphorylase [Xinfangfangia sp. CPCC 101601]MDQ2067537.1 RES family NAD+ phosphorylase [Xinfangfangia sp. CPCC 101601]
MSQPIWTPDALRSEIAPGHGQAWRFVEAQHRVSTLKLIDTLAEQAALEAILETSKPPLPPECAGLDYLFTTPFRYRPYPAGSRFRRAGLTPGVWYGAEAAETAAAEMVFYRFLFYAESPGTPFPDDAAEYTAFAADWASAQVIDLTKGALAQDQALWGELVNYEPCQRLAESARAIGTGVIRYTSVRDPAGGTNLALLTCTAFAKPQPVERQSWRIRIGRTGAQALREHPRLGLEFPPESFADPRLQGMDWSRPRAR